MIHLAVSLTRMIHEKVRKVPTVFPVSRCTEMWLRIQLARVRDHQFAFPKIDETRNAQGPPGFPHTCQMARAYLASVQ
jgi:hypothetical protein